jgi:hypothetical protein
MASDRQPMKLRQTRQQPDTGSFLSHPSLFSKEPLAPPLPMNSLPAALRRRHGARVTVFKHGKIFYQ